MASRTVERRMRSAASQKQRRQKQEQEQTDGIAAVAEDEGLESVVGQGRKESDGGE